MAKKNTEENWQCNLCGKEKDTLYFAGKKQICEDCRNKLRKESHGPIS